MTIAPCPLCHSPGVEHPAQGLLVAGASCSNGSCILHESYQDETNRHIRLDEWPKSLLDKAVEAVVAGGMAVEEAGSSKQDVVALEDYVKHLEARVHHLMLALGHCSQSTDGQHHWAAFPVDDRGRLVMSAANGVYAAAAFCQVCMMPRSLYHDTIPAKEE